MELNIWYDAAYEACEGNFFTAKLEKDLHKAITLACFQDRDTYQAYLEPHLNDIDVIDSLTDFLLGHSIPGAELRSVVNERVLLDIMRTVDVEFDYMKEEANMYAQENPLP